MTNRVLRGIADDSDCSLLAVWGRVVEWHLQIMSLEPSGLVRGILRDEHTQKEPRSSASIQEFRSE